MSLSRASGSSPRLAEAETALDPGRMTLLKNKLIEVIGSSRAFDVQFADPATSSKVPEAVRALTKKGTNAAEFVQQSSAVASYLFELHTGNVSAGLLCVIEVRVAGERGLVFMKLEREAGAQLTEEKVGGKRMFAMSLLDNLVLTDGTRLFKTALFVRKGEDEFYGIASDQQLSPTSVSTMAKFWLRFLGCEFVTAPRVATKQFFEAALKAISDLIPDSAEKAQVFDSLHSELNSNKPTFSPKTFIKDYVPDDYRAPFRTRLQEMKIPLEQFHKDNTDIESKLRRRMYKTKRGAVVTVSEEAASVVEVTDDQVIVNDTVITVG